MASASTSHDLSKQNLEFLLQLNSAKISSVENALEQNWLVHAILSAVGIAMIFNVGDLRSVLAKYFTQEAYDAKAVAAVLFPLFLYHFMRLGQLVTAFNEANKVRKKLLKDYLNGSSESTVSLEPFHASTSFLAESFASTSNKAYAWVTSAIVSTAQASAFFLVWQAYGFNRFSIPILLAGAIAVVVLYIIFWKHQDDHRRASMIISLGVTWFAVVMGLLIVFARSLR